MAVAATTVDPIHAAGTGRIDPRATIADRNVASVTSTSSRQSGTCTVQPGHDDASTVAATWRAISASSSVGMT